MLDPAGLKEVEYIEDNEITLQMENIPPCDMDNIYNIYDEKDFKKYITDVEKCVRNSFEYRQFIDYISKYMGMNDSMFYDEVSSDGNMNVKIERHHTPYTLFDICVIVFNKRMFYQESISVRMVAKEVTMLHYQMLVGLVPLTQNEHLLVHNGYLFVNPNRVQGNWKKFTDSYNSFLLPEQREVLERIEEHAKYYNEKDNTRILEQRTITLDPKLPEYKHPELDTLVNGMCDRIEEVKSNGYRLPTLEETQDRQPKLGGKDK